MRATSVVSWLRMVQLVAGTEELHALVPLGLRIVALRSPYIVCRTSPPTVQFGLSANSTPAPTTLPQITPLELAVTPVGWPKPAPVKLLNWTPVCLASAQARPPVA